MIDLDTVEGFSWVIYSPDYFICSVEAPEVVFLTMRACAYPSVPHILYLTCKEVSVLSSTA